MNANTFNTIAYLESILFRTRTVHWYSTMSRNLNTPYKKFVKETLCDLNALLGPLIGRFGLAINKNLELIFCNMIYKGKCKLCLPKHCPNFSPRRQQILLRFCIHCTYLVRICDIYLSKRTIECILSVKFRNPANSLDCIYQSIN